MNPSTISGGSAINSAAGHPLNGDDVVRTSLPLVGGPNQHLNNSNTLLSTTTTSIGVTIEFADKIESAVSRLLYF